MQQDILKNPVNFSILIPAYNEEANIIATLEETVKVLETFNPSYEIIVIDDGSRDKTRQKVAGFISSGNNRVKIQSYFPNKGKGYALKYGTNFTNGIYTLFLDADLDLHPSHIVEMFELMQENGADVVIGSRKIPGGRIVGWNLWRRITSDGAMFFARLVLNLKTRDVTAGFRCYRRLALEKIDFNRINSSGYAFQEEMIFRMERMGCKIQEIPVTFVDRKFGQSKLSWREAAEFFKVMFKLKFCGKKAP